MPHSTALIDLRLSSIAAAQQRVRTAFFGATITSAIICLIAFNATLSFGRLLPDPPERADPSWKQDIYKERLKAYFSRMSYTMPLLGVSVDIDDLALIGPAAMLIFSLYYAAASRSVKTQILGLMRHLPEELAARQRDLH